MKINEEFSNQAAIDGLIDTMISEALLFPETSLISRINEQAQLNVPGADIDDKHTEEVHIVESVYLDIEDVNSTEQDEVESGNNQYGSMEYIISSRYNTPRHYNPNGKHYYSFTIAT